ncbi:hypothetical protein D4R52_00485 [bacterium]|nr:MAG: hypothetical protein D4R52_00485 [bacterium]
MKLKIKSLKNIYFAVLVLAILLATVTPFVSHNGYFGDIKNGQKIEQMIEIAILLFLFPSSFIIYTLYQKKINTDQQKLDEALRYIGAINIQMEQINSIVEDLKKYPESERDFKSLFQSLADKVLGIIRENWVMFRIIDSTSGRTLTEFSKSRANGASPKFEVSNRLLIENKKADGLDVIESTQDNFEVKAFCIIPQGARAAGQEAILKTIVNNLEMLYIIFTSAYSKTHLAYANGNARR